MWWNLCVINALVSHQCFASSSLLGMAGVCHLVILHVLKLFFTDNCVCSTWCCNIDSLPVCYCWMFCEFQRLSLTHTDKGSYTHWIPCDQSWNLQMINELQLSEFSIKLAWDDGHRLCCFFTFCSYSCIY